MSSTGPQSSPYHNVKFDENGKAVVDLMSSPDRPGKIVRPYVNVTPQESDDSPSSQNHSPSKDSPTKIKFLTKKGDKESLDESSTESVSPIRRHLSETGFRLSNKSSSKKNMLNEKSTDSSPISVEQAITNAKFDLLSQQGASSSKGCEKCDELMELLLSWQIGAGSLMRNYSRILSLLMRTRDSALALECRLAEQAPSSAGPPSSSSSSPSVTSDPFSNNKPSSSSSAVLAGASGRARGLATQDDSSTVASVGAGTNGHDLSKGGSRNRQSMFVTGLGVTQATAANIRNQNMAENMYPDREDLFQPSVPSTPGLAVNPATYTLSLEELKMNLWGAIDLCQQLAAACFKKTHLMNSEKNREKEDLKKSSRSTAEKAGGDSFLLSSSVPTSGFIKRKSSEGAINHSPQFKSSLRTIQEVNKSKNRKKRRNRGEIGLERVPSAPSLECSSEGLTSSGDKDSMCSGDDGFVHVTAEGIPDSVTKTAGKPAESLKDTCAQEGGKMLEGGETMEQQNGIEQDHFGVGGILGNAAAGAGSSEGAETDSLSEHEISPLPGENGEEEEEEEEGVEEPSGVRSESMLSGVSTYTDSDVKYVMSKIASLEEERYKLLETIDKLHNENSTVSIKGVWRGKSGSGRKKS